MLVRYRGLSAHLAGTSRAPEAHGCSQRKTRGGENDGDGARQGDVCPPASSVVAAECGTCRRTCPAGSLPTARPHAPARRKFSRKWIKSRKQLTSQRPSSWCILLYSHPLALNFPAAAWSCFSIGGRIRESRQAAPFLPGLSGLFFLRLPPSLGLHQPPFQGGGVTSCAL